jgi:hypothetical protein
MVEIPIKFWYLEGTELNLVNHQFIVRDLALDSLLKRGLIQRPKAFYAIPLGSSSPYLGVYRIKPVVKKIITNSGRILDTCAVKERGFKSRIITVSDWEYTTLGQYLREPQQKLMGFDDTVPSLTGGSTTDLARKKFNAYHESWKELTDKVYINRLRKYLLSTDLSRCSDLILPSLSKAFLEGFNTGAEFYENSFLRHISTLLYAEREIRYEKGPKKLPPVREGSIKSLHLDRSVESKYFLRRFIYTLSVSSFQDS